MEYSSEVVRRFDAPQRAGELPHGTPGLVSGEAEDRTQNVWIRFDLRVLDGAIQTVRFQAFGCPHTVAAADWTAEWLEGRPVEAAREIGAERVRAALAVPIEKLGKLLKVEDAAAACWRRAVAGT